MNDPHVVLDVPRKSKPRMTETSVHGLDLQLNLERGQRLREEAWSIASEVWSSALSIELSSPELSHIVNDSGQAMLNGIVKIPLTAYFHPDSLSNIHRELKVAVLVSDEENPERRRLAWTGDVSTSRLFAEQIRAPRRLFVRAISESGQVIGVSSPWPWRTDRTVLVHESGSIDVTIWPEHIIHGKADFPNNLLAYDQDIKRFDAVTVLVPDERRTVAIESNEYDPSDKPAVFRNKSFCRQISGVTQELVFGTLDTAGRRISSSSRLSSR